MLKRLGRFVLVFGVVAVLAGATFALQGWGLVGPESSAMFKNSEWVRNGLLIVAAGLIAALAGRLARRI